MTDNDWANKRSERASFARYRCEADGLHHNDCPRFHDGPGAFVLHHVIRRGDRHDPNYERRDDLEHLRFVWNGSTGLGAAGCHGMIHSNQDIARRHGLLAERETHQ